MGECSNQGNCFGQAVAGVGDVNGDGYGDFVIGAWAVDDNVGAAHPTCFPAARR